MGFAHGAGFLFRGLKMWRQRPGLMLLGIVPAVLVLVLLLGLLVAVVLLADDLIDWATPFADDWSEAERGVLRIGLYLAVIVGSLFLSVVTFTGLTLAVGDPFYERIWKGTELMLGGEVPEKGVGWLRGARDGVGLVLLGMATTILVFAVGLVPVIGPIVGPVLGITIAGRLLAGELVSRGLEARGMDRAAQKALLADHRPMMLGFGVVVQLCFLIPFGAVLMMPAAVVGATMLAREVLDAQLPAGTQGV
ncbi:EI24 domain-containing protein [Nocardioides bizhenqiangii]|uniref:EI24 domain-containing protein n=1 Tax=Nocardioides bizhenqiangii TaxID=3095076 RepID=A0ABZ0ZWU9_9ACTN|nr:MULTISPECIES: EI24 domain-containing protein [unclassified Nocardioides]MDZ5623169.1 EI24 domain-containing protein [Nocardioides sp. HM23]WQQ28142.1 EI24 domain-containing protein [Nocardioides sp. HM61]